MKFRIKAVDSKGSERVVTIEASDESSALATARSQGLFAMEVEVFSESPKGIDKPSKLPAGPLSRSATHEYKMVQVPPNISVQEKHYQGSEAAAYLESVVNRFAEQGWEFYRVDAIGVKILPGCLGGLLGQRENVLTYYVITSRRPA